MKLFGYRIHCETEGVDKEVWLPTGSPTPTTCPTDTSHTVTPGATVFGQLPSPMDPMDVVVTNAPEYTSLGVKNQHSMQAWGALKAEFTSSEQTYTLTLSNKSDDGFTFTYSCEDPTFVPRVGDYVFQNNFCLRAWVVEFDSEASTIKFDNETLRPTLSEGAGHYSKGVWIDCDVPDWYGPMYLWGVTTNIFWSDSHSGKNDLVELSIVDFEDFFQNDDFCQAVLGVNASEVVQILTSLGWDLNGEYGHWTKYYDESNVINISGKTLMTPDGAPGELFPHMKCRISYFTSLTTNAVNELYLDYFATAKI